MTADEAMDHVTYSWSDTTDVEAISALRVEVTRLRSKIAEPEALQKRGESIAAVQSLVEALQPRMTLSDAVSRANGAELKLARVEALLHEVVAYVAPDDAGPDRSELSGWWRNFIDGLEEIATRAAAELAEKP